MRKTNLPLMRDLKQQMNGWVILSLVGAAIVLLPNFSILANLFQPPNENWAHISEYMMADYALQSLWLVLFTGLFTVMIGVSLAWLVTAYDFPLKRLFRWAFVLPLAIPPYIAAFTYGTMLSYTGVVQTTLRNGFGLTPDQSWFDIMSVKGAVFIFTMFLFPYVYLITRTFLERQSAAYVETAKLLGKKPLQVFVQVVLPISRGAIVGGVSLVIFEVLNDYGVVSHFGIQTFSTAIFQTWFGMYDLDSAIRLAALLMACIIGLLLIERYLRNRQRYSSSTSKVRPLTPTKLKGLSAASASAFCALIFALSFVIPVLQLIAWAWLTYRDILHASLFRLVINSVTIALLATAIIIVLAAIVANVGRMRRSFFGAIVSRLIAMGYSVPGAVIAIGVLSVFIALDHSLGWLYGWFGMDTKKLLLSTSIVMLIAAYAIRFLSVGFNSIEAGFDKIGNSYSEASRLLGLGMTKTFFKVDLPLIKGAILSACILVFVEIVKELPLTLLLRPYNFETLASETYKYAGDERIQEAAIPALLIIGISMISVLIFNKFGEGSKRNNDVL